MIDVTERRRAEAALRQSEERLRLAMTGAQMGMWDVDLLTGQAIWSEQHFTMLGYEPVTTGEATEEMWMSRIHPDDLERVIQEWQQSRQENRFYRTEYRVIRADNGQISWLAALGNFTYDHNGQAIRSIGVFFDISDRKRDEAERKQAEAALRESEERFRLVTHAVNGLVFDWNLQTNEVYRSEKLYQLVGIKPEDAPPSASWWQERIHPVDYARLQSQAIEMFNSGNPLYEAEYRVLHTDGHWVEVWERGCLIRDQQGQVIRLVGSTVDITERKRTEQALRQAEERLRVALQNAPITVFNQDCKLKYTWLHNPVLYDLNEMIGKGDRDFLPPEDAEILTRVKQQVLETGIGTREEIKLTRNETNYYYDLTVEPLRDANHTIVGITCAAIDISRLKQTEINLRESEARFRGVVESNMVGILFWEASGCITDANEKAVQMLGYSREELQSKQVQWQNITPPEFHELDATMLAQILATGICPPFEKAYIRKDGIKVPILIGCGLLPGYSDRGVAYFIDISERKQAAEALRESEARFRNMADTAPVLIWMSDTSKLCSYFNKQWLDFTGRTMAQELGYGWAEGVHPDDFQYCLDIYTRAFDACQEFTMEYRLRRCDGEYRWLLDHGIPRFTPDGELLGYIGSCIDIHDRKQAEAALAANEARLRGFVEANVVGILYGDIYGNIHEANDELLRIIGYTRADLCAGRLRWIDITPPEYLPLDEQAIAEARLNGACTPYEKEYIRKDGSRVPILLGYSLVGEAREESVVFILDLTEAKQREAAMRDREQRLTLATNAANLGVFEWDITTDHTVWENQRMYDIFGHTLEDGTLSHQQFFHSVIHPDDRQAFEQSLAAGIQLGTLHQMVCRIRRRHDGQWRWIEVNGHFTFAPDGTPFRLVGVISDITERKQAEAALHQSEERLRLAQRAAGAGLWDWDIVNNHVTWSNVYSQAATDSQCAADQPEPSIIKIIS